MSLKENTAPCRSSHRAVLTNATGRTTNTCEDKILLGHHQLAISISTRGRAHQVDVCIRFLSPNRERISYLAWCRKWTPAAIREALQTPPDERSRAYSTSISNA